MAKAERIILGSGKIFVAEFTGTTLPASDVIETAENQLGFIKGGASLEYTPTFYNAKDDLGVVQKSRITEEAAKLKAGVMTINGLTLANLCATARVTDTPASGTTPARRTVKIGGAGNDNGKNYVIHFLHEDPEDGNVRVTIVGRNESGFTLAFAKENETVIDCEFTAFPHDGDGTIIQYVEDVAAYRITHNLFNLTSNGASTIAAGSALSETLTAAQGYSLPTSIVVTIGGTVATVSTDYTYNKNTGAIAITAAKLVGDVVITAIGQSALNQG